MDARLAGGAGHLEAVWIALLEKWNHDVFGGAGISGALEDDELSLLNVRSNRSNRAGDVAEVGLVILVERRGNADDDCVHGGDFGVVRSSAEAGLLRLPNFRGENADDVGTARIELADLVRCNIEAGDVKALFAEKQGEW